MTTTDTTTKTHAAKVTDFEFAGMVQPPKSWNVTVDGVEYFVLTEWDDDVRYGEEDEAEFISIDYLARAHEWEARFDPEDGEIHALVLDAIKKEVRALNLPLFQWVVFSLLRDRKALRGIRFPSIFDDPSMLDPSNIERFRHMPWDDLQELRHRLACKC